MLLFPCHLLFLRRKLAGAVSQPLRSHAITRASFTFGDRNGRTQRCAKT
jgi:hypothetical protein